MEPEYVAEEMECKDGVNGGEEMDVGNGREKMDAGNGRVEMDATGGGNGGKKMDGGEIMDGGNRQVEVDRVIDGEGTGKKGPRKKHKCPYVACNASVVHLPRHMRQVHEWSKSDSAAVLGTFDLRKGKSVVKKKKKKREHPRKVCPKANCGAIIRRLHNHLAQVHKMKRGSYAFSKLVKRAENYLPPVANSSSDESLQ